MQPGNRLESDKTLSDGESGHTDLSLEGLAFGSPVKPLPETETKELDPAATRTAIGKTKPQETGTSAQIIEGMLNKARKYLHSFLITGTYRPPDLSPIRNWPPHTLREAFKFEAREASEVLYNIAHSIRDKGGIHCYALSLAFNDQDKPELGKRIDWAIDETDRVLSVVEEIRKELKAIVAELLKKEPTLSFVKNINLN